MSNELNPAIIKHTQNILGKYVKKPSLTEKLLRKPPFRFLYDVFSVIIRDTKCFVGLYTMEELTYENIKDRDDKMKFLQKMIDVVKLTTGSSLTIKTSKIVAGHEPEKTNELLQLVGEIIEKKLNWHTAVEQVVSGKPISKKSPRKAKDTTNNIIKDSKLKEKLKEKDSRTRDPKIAKTTSKIATTNKDDKTKTSSKSKEKTTKKIVTKEKTLKVSKELEKSVKKLANETNEANSQAKNKNYILPNTQEAAKQLKSIENENETTECNHEDMQRQKEVSKVITPIKKLLIDNKNNEFLSTNDVFSHKSKESSQLNNLSVDKEKTSSAKSRKSVDVFAEDVDKKEHKNNLDIAEPQEKLEITESTFSKQSSLPSTANSEQQPDVLNKNQQEPLSSFSPPKSKHQTPSQPEAEESSVSLINEIKRESTFTRENSKESNKISLVSRPRTSLRPPSARPPSARPGAPRRRDKNIEIILQPNDQIKMSGIQVKLQTFGDLDDDGENLVIIENPNANDVSIVDQSNFHDSDKMGQYETLEQGHLVQQILETQKELVQQETSQEKNDNDSTKNSVMRQTSARHMNNLRDVIQNLTKSINPLGKLMDFIPEDIDAMQLEFTLWRDAYLQAANELKREKSLTESVTEPMKNQLIEIEANITEYMEMINASRVKILQNSEKINKLLTTS